MQDIGKTRAEQYYEALRVLRQIDAELGTV